MNPSDVDMVSDVEFETVVEESGTKIELAIGENFVSEYQGVVVVTDEAGKAYNRHSFRSADGELYSINGKYKIDLGLADVKSGTIVRLTYVKDVPIQGQPSPMKDFRVEVGKAKK